MNTGFRSTSLICILAWTTAASAAGDAGDAGDAAPLRYDHFNPVVLNEFAMQKIREGDTRSAAVLLERAAQLAPHDARIAQNMKTLRAWQAGEPPPSAAPASVPGNAAPPSGEAVGLPSFPLWQNR